MNKFNRCGELKLTGHAVCRLAQRGISANDVELIMLIGSEAVDGYLLRDRDCISLEAALKHLLNRLQRLKGKRVVVAGDRLVTAYHSSRDKQRELRRHASKKGTLQ